MNMNTWVWQES